ncbi:germ cell nuclear acidic protein [Anthonomus grandis grandis]|uniref:germ cell nuclear acidic protein n=1 Tax=Anthonomus grandis grandis TaxID=2921223 RepID=UPI002166114F|nr:germ cell nuclear acidic protein [Anthonomus grandis grandis]
MEESFELLSSMSPKVKGKQKTLKIKKVSRLALKKHFRRSAAFDESLNMRNQDLSIVEVNTESSESIHSSNSLSKPDIIIDSTDSEDSEPPILHKTDKFPLSQGSTGKKNEIIEQWLQDVDGDKKSETFFSQVSTIYGEEQSNLDNDKIAACSSFNDYLTHRFDELFIDKKNDDKVSVIDETFYENSSNLKTGTQDKKGIDLSDSSFNLRFSEDSTSKTDSKVQTPKKKDSMDKKSLSDDSFSLELDVSLKSRIKKQNISKNTLLKEKNNNKDYHHSKTDSLKSAIIMIEDSPVTPIKSNAFITTRKKNFTPKVDNTPTNQNIQEVASLLDSLYGKKWREKEDKVLLPMSEPKKRNPRKIQNIQEPKTERAKKPIKKTNLPATKKLNFDQLKTPIQSPWIQKLKGLIDSDSDGFENRDSPLNNVKTKLNFDDNESKSNVPKKKPGNSMTNKENYPLKISEKIKQIGRIKSKSSSSSDEDVSTDDEYDRQIEFLEVKRKSMMPQKPTKYSFLESLSGCVPLDKCDFSARIFRSQFKQNKIELCNRLFKLYNENIFKNALPEDTELEWNDKLRKTAGLCYCKKITRRTGVVERKVRIALSTKVLDSADRVRDTLIHEMCHAATWIVNEVQDGHGPFWKSWAFKAMQTFPELPPISRCHSYAINSKYTYKCTDCGYSFGRHSKSLDIKTKRCGHCFGKFEILLNKSTKQGRKAVPATPKKEPTGFALFVKENYARYKEPSKKHADVMKVLGQKFAELKVKNGS